MSKDPNYHGLTSSRCPCCNKLFIPAPQHTYKHVINGNTIYTCSYTCWMKKDKEYRGARLQKERDKIQCQLRGERDEY